MASPRKKDPAQRIAHLSAAERRRLFAYRRALWDGIDAFLAGERAEPPSIIEEWDRYRISDLIRSH